MRPDQTHVDTRRRSTGGAIYLEWEIRCFFNKWFKDLIPHPDREQRNDQTGHDYAPFAYTISVSRTVACYECDSIHVLHTTAEEEVEIL